MANKIESAIKKMLGKNEKAAEKLKKKKGPLLIEGPAKAVTDSMATDEEAFSREMKRREAFSVGPGATHKKKKKKGK